MFARNILPKIENPRCTRDLFITNSSGSFQNTTAMVNGLSDVHKIIVTVRRNSSQKSFYRNYKNTDINTFENILNLKLQTKKNSEPFEQVFLETLN